MSAAYAGPPLAEARGPGRLAHGLVDVKVCSVDATCSGLKLVRRLHDR